MLAEIIERVRQNRLTADLTMIEKAYHFAEKAHEGVKRRDGSPYFEHPVAVAQQLAEMDMDEPTICAGLLHDTVEDVELITQEVIEREFSREVAELVDGVTKLERVEFMSKEEQQAESLRKMLVAMAKDIRVVIIKLADRLHNMKTLASMPEEKQRRIARETLEIYAPLAHRLGIFAIKNQLENLCFGILEPEAYRQLSMLVAERLYDREDWISGIISILEQKIGELGMKADITGRPKQLYSIYKKMKAQDLGFDAIYDLVAVRVIVETIPECYAVLGTVHTVWRPMPGRFKDYIAMPKPNMYQSLHTTLLGPNAMPFEVQIRTAEMHRVAEYGVAAHWKYKEGTLREQDFDKKLAWLRQMMDLQSEMGDAREFMRSLKFDIFADEVFVFTPRGDVISLPAGATPIDFAYRIHSEVGNKCVGAKVSGRIVPIDYEIRTGDIIEIMTSNNSRGPSRDWINVARTSQAKAKIKQWFKRELKDENIARGKDMLDREARRLGFSLGELLKGESFEDLKRRYSFTDLDDIYASVGFGGLSTGAVLNRLAEEIRKEQPPPPPPAQHDKPHKGVQGGVFVRGDPGMLVRTARCCSPVPGDAIIGYITRGRGVSVHRADCLNLKDMALEPERMIEVSWDAGGATTYDVDIQIIAYDRTGILAELSALFGEMELPLIALSARTNKNKTTNVSVTIEIKNTAQLDRVMKQLKKNSDIIEAFRISS